MLFWITNLGMGASPTVPEEPSAGTIIAFKMVGGVAYELYRREVA